MNIPWETILTKLESVGLEMTEGVRTGIEFMWPLAVKQVMVRGIGDLIIALIFFVIVYFCWKGIKELGAEFAVLIILTGLIALGFGLYCAHSFIARLLNPQWYAIQELLNLLK